MGNSDNIEKIIDAICDNSAYAWNYYYTLEGLQTLAQNNNSILEKYQHLINSIFYSAWDSLFIRLHHFIEKRKDSISFNYLFKQINKNKISNREILDLISESKKLLEDSLKLKLIKVFKWRNMAVAHIGDKLVLTDNNFYDENKLHLLEVKEILTNFDSIINKFSIRILNRINDTKLYKVKDDILQLFNNPNI